MSKTMIVATLGLLSVACLSGCITSPLNGSTVSTQDTPITISGFAARPNAHLKVQAFNQRNRTWETVATTNSSFHGYQDINGTKWYCYHCRQVMEPQYWTPFSGELPSSSCQLRVLDEYGNKLFSFNRAPDLNGDPIDEWNDKGNRNEEITVFVYR